MKCPGSVSLSYGVKDEESDHALLGTAAHTLGEVCLHMDTDAWEYIGSYIHDGDLFDIPVDAERDIEVDKNMADAVQQYIDAIRDWHPDRNQGNSWIERRFFLPEVHEHFYGTSDFTFYDDEALEVHVWDYKHGAGIVVEAKDNPQLKYYALGMLFELGFFAARDNTLTLSADLKVVLHIAQPRGWHFDGPIRRWSTTSGALVEWLQDELLPAMDRAMVSRDTLSGEHCRFCPARSRACPALLADMNELEMIMTSMGDPEKGADELSNEQVGRFLDLRDMAKIVATAAEKTAFRRMERGQEVPGRKLTSKRVNRQWKDGAEKALKTKFKGACMTKPELRSPAQIEALPGGEAMVTRWAEKPPNAGLTVSKAADARPGVSKSTKSMFKPKSKK